MTYDIVMKNCAFFARHGVFDQEEFLGQRFYVDAALRVEPGQALENDAIDATVDYGAAFQAIEKIVTGKRRYLIEALAFEIGKSLCAQFPQIVTASITIRKPNAPVPGILDYVEVCVTYERSENDG
ncbi:MAG: dihydroneopterin aldolase [Pseudomonadota bacterium]